MIRKEYFKTQVDVRVMVANRFVRTVHFNATVHRMIHQSNESSLKIVLEIFGFVVKYFFVKYATAFCIDFK